VAFKDFPSGEVEDSRGPVPFQRTPAKRDRRNPSLLGEDRGDPVVPGAEIAAGIFPARRVSRLGRPVRTLPLKRKLEIAKGASEADVLAIGSRIRTPSGDGIRV